MDKKAVYEKVVGEYRRTCHQLIGQSIPERAGCVVWSLAGFRVLRRMGVGVTLQAGTMQWPFLDPKLDDGIGPTHLSYVWEPESPVTRAALVRGMLPEIHAWLAILETQEVIDFSTGYLPEQAKEMHGLEWSAPQPPIFLWTTAKEIPNGVCYHASETATLIVADTMQKMIQGARKKHG